jgi:hypothetical protein
MGTSNYNDEFKRDAVHQITVWGYPVLVAAIWPEVCPRNSSEAISVDALPLELEVASGRNVCEDQR